MRMSHAAFALVVLVAVEPAELGAQQMPERPRLPKSADPNDWEAVFDHGVELANRRRSAAALDAFYWAARLEPTRAEPLVAQWSMIHMRDIGRFERYLKGESLALADTAVRRADALRYRGIQRNPFVHRGLEVIAYDALPGRWSNDDATAARLAYAQTKFARAAEYFSRAIARKKKHRWLRFELASTLVAMNQLDSATAVLSTLVAMERAADQVATASVYESKALYEFALGKLHAARGRHGDAVAAYQRALVEDLRFTPALLQLAEYALARRRTAEALGHLEQLLSIAPSDVPALFAYARALGAAGRQVEAVEHLRRVTELEPYYAAAHLALARALAAGGDPAATESYLAFLATATRDHPARAEAHAAAALVAR